jgi:transcriptional regulator with XRE-family HTH domain
VRSPGAAGTGPVLADRQGVDVDEATRKLIGQTLQRLRKQADLSQPQLARLVPVSTASLSRYESGNQKIDSATATRLDELLDTGGALGRLVAGKSARTDTMLPGYYIPQPLPDSLMGSVGHGLDSMRAMSCAFQAADRRMGGGKLYGAVVRYLVNEVSPSLLDAASNESGRDLFSAAASLTEVAGWMAHDGGMNDRARRHFDHAFRLSSAAETSR